MYKVAKRKNIVYDIADSVTRCHKSFNVFHLPIYSIVNKYSTTFKTNTIFHQKTTRYVISNG